MGKVFLEGMEFFGYHGMYPEERVLGNRFLVNLELHTDFEDAMLTDRLEGTVDYAQLYQLVKVRMENRVQLLEHLGYNIHSGHSCRFSSSRSNTDYPQKASACYRWFDGFFRSNYFLSGRFFLSNPCIPERNFRKFEQNFGLLLDST